MKKYILLLFVLVLASSCKMNINGPSDNTYVELSIVSVSMTSAQFSIKSSAQISSFRNMRIYETKTGKELTFTFKDSYGDIYYLLPNTEYTIVASVTSEYTYESLLSKPVTFTTSK